MVHTKYQLIKGTTSPIPLTKIPKNTLNGMHMLKATYSKNEIKHKNK